MYGLAAQPIPVSYTHLMHLEGFRTALTKAVNDYGTRQGILKEKDPKLTGDDIREGLTAVISVKLPDPQFEGQTKAKLGSCLLYTSL